jgi:deazaflavin-dependent oxidoreductase (nitroreductase family)
MSSASTRLTRWGNAIGVWLYRRTGGRLVGPSRGTTIGLLTTPGRNTGILRTVSIGFHPNGAGYVVAGTGSGSPREPQWFRNLRATPHAEIQIRATRTDVDVRIAENNERERLWNDVILAQAPWRQRYEKKSGRIIPVAILTPSHPES